MLGKVAVSGLPSGSEGFVVKYTPKSVVGQPLASSGTGLFVGSHGAVIEANPRACFMISTKVRSLSPQSFTQLILIPILEPALPEDDATVMAVDWVAAPPAAPVQVSV